MKGLCKGKACRVLSEIKSISIALQTVAMFELRAGVAISVLESTQQTYKPIISN